MMRKNKFAVRILHGKKGLVILTNRLVNKHTIKKIIRLTNKYCGSNYLLDCTNYTYLVMCFFTNSDGYNNQFFNYWKKPFFSMHDSDEKPF